MVKIKNVEVATILLCLCFSSIMDIKIDTLGYFVDRVYSKMIKFLNYKLTEEGLDIQYTQFVILMILSKKDGIDQSALSEYANRDKGSISRNIKTLEEKGFLIVKQMDGKKKIIFLSNKGKELIPHLYEIGDFNTETYLKGFTKRERDFIFEMLEKIYKNVSSALKN